MAMYVSHLAMDNTLLSQSLKTNTIRLYLKAAAIIQEQHRWESVPNRQEPVTVEMVLQEHHTGHKGKFAIWNEKLGGDGSSKAFIQKD
eukprot:11591385-Ditylum_brightwellii.AAC.1